MDEPPDPPLRVDDVPPVPAIPPVRAASTSSVSVPVLAPQAAVAIAARTRPSAPHFMLLSAKIEPRMTMLQTHPPRKSRFS
jgi:hypothetical protein